MMTHETVRWENSQQGEMEASRPSYNPPSLQSNQSLRARPRVTAWKAEPTQTYPCLDPTCQPQAADGVGVGHNW